MGTTTTPVLGLVKPDGTEPGKNWPAQWATNADILDHIPNVQKRIATTIETVDGTSSVNETVAATVAAPVVSGRVYRVTFDGAIEGGAVDDRVVVRIREDSILGSLLQVRNRVILHTSGTVGNPSYVTAEYTADITGNKIFVATYDTAQINAVSLAATDLAPTYFYVDYIRG